MAEILKEYTNLLETSPSKAIDYVKQNKEDINKFLDSDELILNAKVRFLEQYPNEFESIKQEVLSIENLFTSHSAIICNFLIKSKGHMTLEEEQTLESKLLANPTRFSVMYFITQKADEISNLKIKEQLEQPYLDFAKQVIEKTLLNINKQEKDQLTRFIAMDMERSDISNKAFDIARSLL